MSLPAVSLLTLLNKAKSFVAVSFLVSVLLADATAVVSVDFELTDNLPFNAALALSKLPKISTLAYTSQNSNCAEPCNNFLTRSGSVTPGNSINTRLLPCCN